VDGKAVRGAVGKDGKQVHLLGALVHKQAVVIGQRQVDGKTVHSGQFGRTFRPKAATHSG